jgi:hypothetical protein
MAKKKKKANKGKSKGAAKKVNTKVKVKKTGTSKKKTQVKSAPKKGPRKVSKKVTKEAKKKIISIHTLKNRLASTLLILGAVLVMVFIANFLVQRILSPVQIAEILPEENTTLMMEFDLTKALGDGGELKEITNKEGLDLDSFVTLVEESLDAEFETEIKPWLGYKHGYALLETEDEEGVNSYEHVIFVQSIDRDATLEFLQAFQLESQKDNLVTEKYNNYSIYSFEVGQNVNFMIFDKYFVFARSDRALKTIVDVHMGEVEALAKSGEFLKVRNNLKRDIGFVYYVPPRLFEYYIGENPTSSSSIIQPVISLFDSQGHSLFLDDNALIVQTYMNFTTDGGAGKKLSNLSSHYKGDLLDVMPENYEYFWGSRNLSQMITDLGGVLNSLHPSSFNIFEGILNAKKEQYFGYEVDLRDDVYRVFEGEFALALYSEPDYINYLFIAEDQDPDHMAKLQALYLEQMKQRGYMVLPEETSEEGEVAPETELEISVFPYDAHTNVYTTTRDGVLLLSTDRKLIVAAVDNLTESSSNKNKAKINSYLKDFDEVNIMSPAFMGELLGGKVASFLNNFTSVQAAKKIFLDGVAIVHVFEF